MKASDFRIGNYLWLKCHHHPVYIEQIFLQDNCYWIVTDLHEGEKLEIYDPIPITTDWLLKFGFEFYGVDNFGYLKYVLCGVIDGTSDFRIMGLDGKWFPQIDSEICCWSEFKYIHQLQNLYFALTGQEF